ncbi:hypothetical protein GCM10027082_32930 [Comamonas humi]
MEDGDAAADIKLTCENQKQRTEQVSAVAKNGFKAQRGHARPPAQA